MGNNISSYTSVFDRLLPVLWAEIGVKIMGLINIEKAVEDYRKFLEENIDKNCELEYDVTFSVSELPLVRKTVGTQRYDLWNRNAKAVKEIDND